MKVLLATVRARPGETTYSERWMFTDDANLGVTEHSVIVEDSDNAGTNDRPYWLVLNLADYEEIKVVKGA